IGKSHGERGALTEPPRAVRASGGLCRQVPADAETTQLRIAGASALPLLPDDRPKAASDPLVKPAQHRRGFADAEVSPPPDQVAGEVFDDLREARSPCPARQF